RRPSTNVILTDPFGCSRRDQVTPWGWPSRYPYRCSLRTSSRCTSSSVGRVPCHRYHLPEPGPPIAYTPAGFWSKSLGKQGISTCSLSPARAYPMRPTRIFTHPHYPASFHSRECTYPMNNKIRVTRMQTPPAPVCPKERLYSRTL